MRLRCAAEVKGVNNYSDNGVTLGQSYEDWRVIYPGEEVNLDYFYVSGALQDGTTFDSLGVNWDTYDRCPQKDCTITGTVAGTNIPVKVHVIVTKNWEAQPQTITVLKGSDGTAMLPSYAELVSPDAVEHPGLFAQIRRGQVEHEGLRLDPGRRGSRHCNN